MYKDQRNNISKVVNKTKKNAKLAKLDYELLYYDKIKHFGHSIFGDQKYGTRGRGKQIALWAYELQVKHPITKELITFKCLPQPVGTWCVLKNVDC